MLYDQLEASTFSRHDLIFLTYDFCTGNNNDSKHTFQFKNFKNVNKTDIENHINTIEWNNIFYMPSPDDQINFLNTNLNIVFNQNVPLKTKVVDNEVQKWFTFRIKDLMNQRDLAYRRWKKYRVQELLF